MNDLLLRFLRGETGEDENRQVAAWLDQSAEHRAQLEQLETVLLLARGRDQRMDAGQPPTASEIIFQAGLRAADVPAPRVAWYRRTLIPVAFAAGAACLALGALGSRVIGGSGSSMRLAAEEFSTGTGESTTVRMNDGSVVLLGPESRLEILPADAGRQVVLEGRAFFAVAHDESRPFRVTTPAGSVRVLGTRFELRAEVSDLRLVVVEGSVALATGTSEVQVHTGEMTEVSRGKQAQVVKAPGLGELADEWMGQFLLFQETSLAQAAREVGQVYGVDVRIADPALESRTLTMWFSSKSLDEVLSVVCSVIDTSCRIDDGVVTIGSEGRGGASGGGSF